MYNSSQIDYTDYKIKGYFIEYELDSGNLKSYPKYDADTMIGKPEMKQGEKEFRSENLTYNFKNKSGLIKSLKTKEGEGYLHAELSLKDSNDILWSKHAKYTTCDLEEHQHFYFMSSKIKLIPQKSIIR